MNITRCTIGMTSKDKYNMTLSPKIGKMSDHKGERINVHLYAFYEDTDKDGNTREILSIMDNDGNVYATNSATFKADFEKILDITDDDAFDDLTIEVISGTSKSGREFITCAFV